MRKIRMLLDYHCSPLWVYDDQGKLIKNGIADELINDSEILELDRNIRTIYDSLFIDDAVRFEYLGLKTILMKPPFTQRSAH